MFRLICTVLLLSPVVLLFGCPDGGFGRVHPELAVSPLTLDYGEVPVLHHRALGVAVGNQGQAPLDVQEVAIGGEDASYFTTPGLPERIEVGDEISLEITFRPEEERAYSASAVLSSNDPNLPTVEIALVGEGRLVSAIEVEPKSLEFGLVGEGELAVETFIIKSVGEAPLVVEKLGFVEGTPEAFFPAGSWAVPATLEPGSSMNVSVAFGPEEGYERTAATVVVKSSDPERREVLVSLFSDVNRAPVAICWDDEPIVKAPGDVVTLDGSESYDPDGHEPLSYEWEIVRRPVTSQTELIDNDTATPSLELDVAGTWEVALTVADTLGTESVAACRVVIQAVPGEHLYVELVWDHAVTDLDLHVIADDEALFGENDCWWGNPSAYDCQHSGDDLAGFGPEWVRLAAPSSGTYTVAVHFAKTNGAEDPRTKATVRVYQYGVLEAEKQRVLTASGEVWKVLEVEWPSGEVNPINRLAEVEEVR